ncbi:MAG: hypothetical protein JWL69_1660 [Phycisphaerales bacterium]|jgi:hypothetical protein|nr:hypothetical protein [Phycisphaerales bacterium]MDB5356843.1 hypothetical protein [Phycisphaerales bacterium]
MAMHGGKNRKQRGRSVISKIQQPSSTHPNVPEEQFTEVNRAVTASGNMNKHRGDRRDTNKYYTGNQSHASRGSNARRDVSTRAR